MRKKITRRALIFIVPSILTINNWLLAQETKTYILDEIIVTATKIKEPKKDISASVQVITQEDIKNSTAKNAGDLIAEAGLGHIHKYPGALVGFIAVRGFRTDLFDDRKSKVLILINGHRVSTVNLAKIPVEDIERIEIVKGPASVLYGSQAMGGVINIITKEGKEGNRVFIGYEVGSWKYRKVQAELNGKKGPFDFYLTLTHSLSDDYEAKDYGRIENSSYNGETISGRVKYKLFDKHHLSLTFQYWQGREIGSPGPRYSPDPDDYSNKKRNSFDISYRTDTFDAKYYFIKDKDEWHEGPTAGVWEKPNSIYLKKTDSQGACLQKTFIIGDIHRVLLGSQWERIEVKSSSIGIPHYSPNSRYNTYGVFTEGRLSLLNKKLLLSAGTRYDYFKNEILETPLMPSLQPRKEDLQHVTGRGGVVYKLTKSLNLKGNIGTAFRAPAPEELAADYVFWGKRTLGNPNLKPEKSISYDIGIDYTKELFKSEITFFHTEFEDKILNYYDTLLQVATFKNVKGATLQGIEGNLSYNIGLALGLKVSIEPFTNITYHTRYLSKDELEIEKYGKTLLYTPKWTGAFGIKLGQDKWGARLIANYIGPERVFDWSKYSAPVPAPVINKSDFMVWNLKGSYRPIKNLEITFSIENLFDESYEYVLSYPMPKRTVIVGTKWIF